MCGNFHCLRYLGVSFSKFVGTLVSSLHILRVTVGLTIFDLNYFRSMTIGCFIATFGVMIVLLEIFRIDILQTYCAFYYTWVGRGNARRLQRMETGEREWDTNLKHTTTKPLTHIKHTKHAH